MTQRNRGNFFGDRMKMLFRHILTGIALLSALPFILSFQVKRIFIGKQRAFVGSSQALSLFPGMIGHFLRRGFYVMTLKYCSPRSTIDFGTFFPSTNVIIRDNVYIGSRCIIAPCVIEKDVIVGSSVHIVSKNTHFYEALDIPIRKQGGSWQLITVDRDCWIGNKSVVMANIGEQCVIGAGSVVTKPIAAQSIAVGNPARVIRKR